MHGDDTLLQEKYAGRIKHIGGPQVENPFYIYIAETLIVAMPLDLFPPLVCTASCCICWRKETDMAMF
jgi:hypothetical protein